MPDFLKDLMKPESIGHLPFMMMNMATGKAKFNYARMAEIAFLAGMLYAGFRVIQSDIAEMKPAVKQIPVLQSQVEGLDRRQMRVEDHLMELSKDRRLPGR